MKNAKTILPVLSILLATSLSCTFLKDKFAKSGEPAHEFSRIATLPPFDPEEPFVSPGAVAVRELAKLEPAVAPFASRIEVTERGAMKQVIVANPRLPETDKQKVKAFSNSPTYETRTALMAVAKPMSAGNPIAALMMFQAGDTPLPGMNDGAFVGMFAGQFKSMLSEVEAGSFSKKDSRTETSEDTTTTMDVEMGASQDGSTVFGLGLKTESTKNGVKVTTDLQAKIEGNDCPNAEGQVQITVKVRMSARSGSSGYTQDLTVFIRIQVDDNANISSKTIDIDQATSRGKNGKEVYVQTGETAKFGADFSNGTTSNQRVIQKTDNATDSDIQELWSSGQRVAYGAAIGAIVVAENNWKGGKCIKIEAKAPGLVDPGSGIEIPVKVRHKKEGSDLVAKLEAELVGEASIDPAVIPKTPGTLMYVAPGEKGKTATIKLKATCRRGIATLDLPASTGGKSYHVSGVSNGVSFTGEICSLDRQFDIDAKFPGGTAQTTFLVGGKTYVNGGGGGCEHSGEGTYSVKLHDDGSGTLTWTTSDTIACDAFSKSKTQTFTLPLQPAPDLSCP